MFDFPLMLRVKLPIVDKIYPQRNKFAMSVENKATGGDSKLDESPTSRGTPPSLKGPVHKSVHASYNITLFYCQAK